MSLSASEPRGELAAIVSEPMAAQLRLQLCILDAMLRREPPNLTGAVALLDLIIDALLRTDPPGFAAAMQLLETVQACVESDGRRRH